MDIGQVLSSLNLIAIIALIVTLLVLLFELRHVFFHKKVAQAPVIPDFDGSIHISQDSQDPNARHATAIDVESLEQGSGVNLAVIMVLLGIMTVLLIIILGGILLKQHPTGQQISPTPIPTEIIEIKNITPTSPFGTPIEVPFDLSGTPSQNMPSDTPEASSTPPLISSSPLTPPISPSSPRLPSPTQSGSGIGGQASSPPLSPTLPVSGNYQIFIFVALIPAALITLAILF